MQTDENRSNARFEPISINANVSLPNGGEIRGRVLDSSKTGMAIALPENAALPLSGTEVRLNISATDGNGSQKTVGSATVLRHWISSGLLDNGKGIAVRLKEILSNHELEADLLQGMQQKSRLVSQANLAAIDIKYLGDYRRDLIACQMKLFILTLTAGVALAGAYFSLSYHSTVANQLGNPELSFWRTMVAALPGVLAFACAIMVAQKDISIQRVDAYLLVLKKCGVLNQYPREYRGWESEYRKFRFALKTDNCEDCEVERKCGRHTAEDDRQLARRGFLWNPRQDVYHIVIYMSFIVVSGLSTYAAVAELLRYNMGIAFNMKVASLITAGFMAAVGALLYVQYQIRKGWYSVDHFKRCWIDIMNKCRVPV